MRSVILLPILIATVARADLVAWYAASNDTPASAGWTLDNSSGAPIVPGPESMLIGPSTYSGLAAFCFDTSALNPVGVPVTVQVTTRIEQATYGNQSGFLRSGFAIFLTNELGQFAAAEIGPAAVALRTENNGLASPSVPFDATDGFHTYTLTIDAGQATLLIDGQPALTAAAGGSSTPNTACFGDVTILGSSTSHTRSAIVATGQPPCNGADLVAPFGSLTFFDVAEFISRYNTHDPSTDLAAPFGVWNFFDVTAYIDLYNAGCL